MSQEQLQPQQPAENSQGINNQTSPENTLQDQSLVVGNVTEQVYAKSRELGKELAEEDLTSEKGLKKFFGGISKPVRERLHAKNIRQVFEEDLTESSEKPKRSAKKQAKLEEIRGRLAEKNVTGKAVYSEAHQQLVELASAKTAGIEGVSASIEEANSPLSTKFREEVLVELAVLKAGGVSINRELVHQQLEKFIKDNSPSPKNTEEEIARKREIQKQIKIYFGREGRKGTEDALVEYVNSLALDVYSNDTSKENIRQDVSQRMQNLQIMLVNPEIARSTHITNGDVLARKIGSVFGAEDAAEIASAAVGGVLVGGVARTAATISANAVLPGFGTAISSAVVGGAAAGIKGAEQLRNTAAQVQSEYIAPESVSDEAIAAKKAAIAEQYKQIKIGKIAVGEFLSKHPNLIDYMGGFTVVDLQQVIVASSEYIDNVSAQQRAEAFHNVDWNDRKQALTLFADTQARLKLGREYQKKSVELLPQEAGKEKVQILSEMIAFKEALFSHGFTESDITQAQEEFDRKHLEGWQFSVEEQVQAVDSYIKGKVIKQVMSGAVMGLAGAGIGYSGHALLAEAGKLASEAVNAVQHVNVTQLGNEVLNNFSDTAHAATLNGAHTNLSTLAQQHLEQYGNFDQTTAVRTIQESSTGTVQLVREPDGSLMLVHRGIGDGPEFPARNWILKEDPHDHTRFLFYRSDIQNHPDPITYQENGVRKLVTLPRDSIPAMDHSVRVETVTTIKDTDSLSAIAQELDPNVTVDAGTKIYLPDLDKVISLDTSAYPDATVHVGSAGQVVIRYQGHDIAATIRQYTDKNNVTRLGLYNGMQKLIVPDVEANGEHLIPVQVDLFARNLVQTNAPISVDLPAVHGQANLINHNMAMTFDNQTAEQIREALRLRHEHGAWQLTVSPTEHIYIKDPEFYKSVEIINADGSTKTITGPQAQALFRTYAHQYVGLAQGADHHITRVDLMTKVQTWPDPLARVNDVDVDANTVTVDNDLMPLLQEHLVHVNINNVQVTVDILGGEQVNGNEVIDTTNGHVVGVFDAKGAFHYNDVNGNPHIILMHQDGIIDITDAKDVNPLNPDEIKQILNPDTQPPTPAATATTEAATATPTPAATPKPTETPIPANTPVATSTAQATVNTGSQNGVTQPSGGNEYFGKGLVDAFNSQPMFAKAGETAAIIGGVAGWGMAIREGIRNRRNGAPRTPDQLEATVITEDERTEFNRAYKSFTDALNYLPRFHEDEEGLTRPFYSPVSLMTINLENIRLMAAGSTHPIHLDPDTVIEWPAGMDVFYEDFKYTADNAPSDPSLDPDHPYVKLNKSMRVLYEMMEDPVLLQTLRKNPVYAAYEAADQRILNTIQGQVTSEELADVAQILEAGRYLQAKYALDLVVIPSTPPVLPPLPPKPGPGGNPSGGQGTPDGSSAGSGTSIHEPGIIDLTVLPRMRSVLQHKSADTSSDSLAAEAAIDLDAAAIHEQLVHLENPAVKKKIIDKRFPHEENTPDAGSEYAVSKTTISDTRHPERNEDFGTFDAEKGIIILADGMGGYGGGDIASKLIVETVTPYVTAIPEGVMRGDITAAFKEGWTLANKRLIEAGRDRRNPRMGATLSLVKVFTEGDRKMAAVLNIGDSRAYMVRKGNKQLVQLTHDDMGALIHKNGKSYIFRMGVFEEITNEEAVHIEKLLDSVQSGNEIPYEDSNARYVFAQRHLIGRALDASEVHEMPEIVFVDVTDAEFLAVECDGIHDNLTEVEIQAIARYANSAQEFSALLTHAARLRSEEFSSDPDLRGVQRAKQDDLTSVCLQILPSTPPIVPFNSSPPPVPDWARMVPIPVKNGEDEEEDEAEIAAEIPIESAEDGLREEYLAEKPVLEKKRRISKRGKKYRPTKAGGR